MIEPHHADPIHIVSFEQLRHEVTKAAVGGQEFGLHITPASFDTKIARELIGYAQKASLGSYDLVELPTDETYLVGEDDGRLQNNAFRVADVAHPGIRSALMDGITDSFSTIHPAGSRALRPTLSTNLGAPRRPFQDWHRDSGQQVAVVVAPNQFLMHYADSTRRAKRGNHTSITMPSAIVGIRGTGGILNTKQHGIAHTFDNPSADAWRHSVVARAQIRPFRLR